MSDSLQTLGPSLQVLTVKWPQQAADMDDMDTLLNPDFTYHLDKISCMKGAYYAHVTFCYLMFLAGLACFIVRAIPSLRWTHAWFGRAYIIAMLWATATSLIIHNSGLPPATLISFVWVLGGMTIAWVGDYQDRRQHLGRAWPPRAC